ncbi:M13 family metallopeptidase, partial [Mycoplasmopsis pullorum]|uniref:M13 family metallopeptidase n=1 Tax=Mycoplasmopsis pullorum TaxID=48003 RepID=UPI00111A80AB
MDKNLLKNDFYDALNKEWLDSHEIPADRSSIGTFVVLDIELEKLLIDLSKGWASGSKELPNDSRIHEYAKFYQMVSDWQTRKKLGMDPIRPIISKIESLKSFSEINEKFVELSDEIYGLPYSVDCYNDFKNSEIYTMWLGVPGIILPEKKQYQDEKRKAELLNKYSEVARKLLVKFGKNESEIDRIIANTLKFDELLVAMQLSSEERAIVTNFYNPTELTVLKEKFGFDIDVHVKQLVNQDVEKIILGSAHILDNFGKIFTEENFEMYRDFLVVKNLFFFGKFLDNDTRILSGEYGRFVSGTKEAESEEKNAHNTALSFFNMPVGQYYGIEYFGPKAKKDVENMICNMVQVYKERLEKNTFLTPKTIEKAILKLNTLNIMVGYPEEIEPYYDEYKVQTYADGGNVISNIINFGKLSTRWNLSRYNQKVNKKLWGMTPAMINAYYSPTTNSIVFPAGILQKPFYSLDQDSSQNFGGIGTVIAHEISHGFDNNGALFDEKGNMQNWWTEEDFAKFKEKTQDVINLFEGVETAYGPCNGKLTVSENIADMGGFACALEAAKRESDYNIRHFFENYATIWRIKYTDKLSKLLLQTDVHAPAKLRANVQLKNNPDFQKEYNLQEGCL